MKRLPHGIEHLRALDDIYLQNTVYELIEMLRQEHETAECKQELMKIGHIRKVIIVSTEKNFWRRIIFRKREWMSCLKACMLAATPKVNVQGMRLCSFFFVRSAGGNTLSLLNVSLVSFSSGCCCLCCAALVVQFSTQWSLVREHALSYWARRHRPFT